MRLAILILLVTSCFSVYAEEVSVVGDDKIVFDTSRYKLQADFKKAAMRAFISRGWEITAATDKKVSAKLYDKSYSSVDIDISNPDSIIFQYVEPNKDMSTGYLLNLKRDLLDNLLSCVFAK